jgi:tyrosine aminotransferase
LSPGDPTIDGNFKTDEFVNKVLIESINSYKYNGYAHSCGYPHVRKVVAKFFSDAEHPPLTEDDVILTSGCSNAIEMCITVLANENDNILVPRPGFSLYETVCGHRGIEPLYYDLLPEKNWEANLTHLESLINSKTRAIIVNNPSNPCGSVYSKEHIKEIIAVAEKHRLPIIADEIYGQLTFTGYDFFSFSSQSINVPILSVGGIAKSYLVPGWRHGWIVIHDRHNLLQQVRVGLLRLSTLILGPNTLIQSVIPQLLNEIPKEYFTRVKDQLQTNTRFLYNSITKIPGLHPIEPQGAMYMMIKVDIEKLVGFENDIDFSRRLLAEECVYVLPGSVFHLPNFIRLCVCPPIDKLETACERLVLFCNRYKKPSDTD